MENGARASVHGHDGRRSPKRRWQEPEKEPEREKVKERKRPRWRCRRGKSPAQHGTSGAAPHTSPRPCLPTGPFWLLAPSGVLRRQCMLRTVPYSLLDITTVTALPTPRCTCTQHALTTAQRAADRPVPVPIHTRRPIVSPTRRSSVLPPSRSLDGCFDRSSKHLYRSYTHPQGP